MSFTVTTNKELKGAGVYVVSPEVFNKVSALGGFGVKATGFDASDGGLAVNEQTENFAEIKALITGKEKKEGN